MIRRPPRSTRTDTLCPYTTLFRSRLDLLAAAGNEVHDLELVGGRVARIHQRVPRRVASSASSCSWRSRTICGGCGDQSKNTGTSRPRSEEHTSELQSLMRISYAVFCLQKKKIKTT